MRKNLGIVVIFLLVGITIGGLSHTAEGEDVLATGYYVIYESEIDGTQTVTLTISGRTYTLKASFLFGGFGVAMQGTGRTAPGGDYIHYDGGGAPFVNITDMTDEVRERYAGLGITDFAGFGGLALAYPAQARYSVVPGVIGASGRTLISWYSIAVDRYDPVIPLNTTGILCFKSGTTPEGSQSMSFSVDDTGAGGPNWIDIYLGEGQAALQGWYDTGGNRYVNLKCGVDVVLVIDRSGSMDDYWFGYYDPKITAAKDAAKMFVDLMQVNDKVGVVSFSSSASVNYDLTRIDATDPAVSIVKKAVKDKINLISAGGATSIGDGLYVGQSQLNTKGVEDPIWAMVLLSDGWENTPPMVKDVLPGIKESKTQVYTIGLGAGADADLLNIIAVETGGFYSFAPSSEELQKIYNAIAGIIAGQQTVISRSGGVTQGSVATEKVVIDSSIVSATFSTTWGGSDLDLTLIQPDGKVIDPSVAATDPNITYTSAPTYELYTINSPLPGEWTMEIYGVDTPPEGETYNANVTGFSDLTLSVDLDRPEYLPGDPIKVVAELKDSLGPILGASVVADVQTPSIADTLTLYDDGAHSDGAADDGVYAHSYTNTSQRGSYTFKVDASGTSNTGDAFTRTATKSTVVGRDSDNDGMPDVWEDIYGLDKYRDDSGEDPDNDGLTNLEEYTSRTHPKNPDTDGDGYSDGEEVAAGSDPLDPNSIPSVPGDLDGDFDVDRDDLNILLNYRNQPASVCPECDIDGDGMITALDARKLVLLCTRPRCAVE